MVRLSTKFVWSSIFSGIFAVKRQWLFVGLLVLMGGLPLRAEVQLSGLNAEMTAVVEAQLSLWTQPCELNRWAVRYQFSRVEPEVRDALVSFGYYSPVINSKLEWGVPQVDCWRATIELDPGPPVVIRESQFKVLPENNFFSALPLLGIAPGEQFDHQRYENFKASLEQIATEKGFFDAFLVTHEVAVDPVQLAADIHLEWHVGQRYSLGAVSYVGSDLEEDILNRYLPFKAGDPFDAKMLGEFYQALLSSDYFTDVSIDAAVDTAIDRQIPVVVNLTPIDPIETRLGVGYSTDIGARASISHINKRVNQKGHRIEGTLAVAERESEVGGFYRIPDADYAEGWTSFYAGLKKTNTDTSEVTTSKLGVRQLVLVRSNWIMTRFIEVVNDNFLIAATENATTNLVPGVSFNRTHTELSRRPRSGYRLGLGLSGTSRAIGSESDFVNMFANAKVIWPLWPTGRLITRGQVAAVVSNNFEALPPGNRYFTGGDNKVRGFDFQSLGPVDSAGAVIGGNRLLELSVEVDQKIAENWAIALFSDAGSASLNQFATTFSTSVGFGVRWYSPIGPVQVDLASPLDNNEVRLHISLGPEL
jgi:translocation and assembly module TamA